MRKRAANSESRERFGRFLRACREQLGLNQAEMGDAVGISQGSVSNWELGTVAYHTPEELRAWANGITAKGMRVTMARILMEAGYLTHADLAAADPTSYVSPLLILLGERLPPLVNEDDVDLVVRLAWAAREWAEAHGAPEVRTAGQTTQVERPEQPEAEPPQSTAGTS